MTAEQATELQTQAWSLQAEGKLTEAFAAAEQALRWVEACEGAASPDTANLLNDLADIERDRQNFTAALALVLRAQGIEAAWAHPISTDLDSAEERARIRLKTSSLLGELRRLQGNYGEAEADLAGALAVAVQAFGDASEETANAQNELAVLYKYWGRFDEALELYEQSLRTLSALYGEGSLAASAVLHNIGGVLHSRGDFAAAEGPAREAWESSRRALGEDAPRALLDATAYAAILDGQKRFSESEGVYLRALPLLQASFGAEHSEVAATLHNLAASVAAQGRLEEAEEKYRQALRIKEALFAVDAPEIAFTRNNLGRLLSDAGRHSEAIPLLEAAVTVLEKCFIAGHPHLIAAQANLERARRPG